MHNYFVIFILIAGFAVNMKIIDLIIYKGEDYRQKEFEKKYSFRVLIISIFFYFISFLSLFFSNLAPNQVIIASILFNMLYIISLIDFFTMYVYERVLFGYTVLIFLAKILLGEMNFVVSFYLLLIGGGVYGIIKLITGFIYKKEAFGLGDVYLMAVLSSLLQFETILFAMFVPFYIAFIAIVVLYIISRAFPNRLSFKSEIPFCPYICIGGWIIFVYGDCITSMYFNIVGI